jgi:hypothetical protein
MILFKERFRIQNSLIDIIFVHVPWFYPALFNIEQM